MAPAQSTVCVLAIQAGKYSNIMAVAPFDPEKGKKCTWHGGCCRSPGDHGWCGALTRAAGFPISLLLVGVIYTGAKALQFLSVPVYKPSSRT